MPYPDDAFTNEDAAEIDQTKGENMQGWWHHRLWILTHVCMCETTITVSIQNGSIAPQNLSLVLSL